MSARFDAVPSGILASRSRGMDRDQVFALLWGTKKMDTAEIAETVSAMRGVSISEAEVCKSLRRPGEVRL